jgi:hypothetical protein
VSSAESPGLGGADRKPDEVQEEVEHDESGGDPEDVLEITSYSRWLMIEQKKSVSEQIFSIRGRKFNRAARARRISVQIH